MLAPYRFVLLSFSIALALSACQPNADSIDTSQITPIEEAAPTVTTAEAESDMSTYIDNDISASDMVADQAPMTDMLKDYNRAIAKMNDEMMIGMRYNAPDTAFAKGMIGHHRGAVAMAKTQLKYGTDTEMRKLAQRIIDNQQAEIATINRWLASHPDAARARLETPFMQQEYADSMEVMHNDIMLGITDLMPDMAFARSLLPHHIGAVNMAKIELKYGEDEEMLELAKQIIANQQPEIKLMQDWIAAHNADAKLIEDDVADIELEKKADQPSI